MYVIKSSVTPGMLNVSKSSVTPGMLNVSKSSVTPGMLNVSKSSVTPGSSQYRYSFHHKFPDSVNLYTRNGDSLSRFGNSGFT